MAIKTLPLNLLSTNTRASFVELFCNFHELKLQVLRCPFVCLNFILFYVHECFICMKVCSPHLCLVPETRDKCQSLWNWSPRWMWATVLMLEIQLSLLEEPVLLVLLGSESTLQSQALVDFVDYNHFTCFWHWYFRYHTTWNKNIFKIYTS